MFMSNDGLYAHFTGFNGSLNIRNTYLVKLDTSLNIISSIPLIKDSIKSYASYYTYYNQEKMSSTATVI